VLRWTDIDPEKPGDHWQDSPAFDPETNGRAIRLYEQGLEAALGFPVNFEATGGDPTEQERKALEELIRGTYPECRRFDSELLRRCAAMVNSLPDDLLPAELRGSDYRTSPYEVLYRDEVADALKAAEEAAKPKTTPEQQQQVMARLRKSMDLPEEEE
jgi:hypothetical protein